MSGETHRSVMDGNATSLASRRRTSHSRSSGIHARWSARISQTTVGGFGGGGVKRPDRSDPLTSAILNKRIRFHRPTGLLAGAMKARQSSHQTQANLDLVWSVESSEWDTTSGSNLTSNVESEWSSSEDEVEIDDDDAEENPNEDKGELRIEALEEEGEAEEKSDPWPEPDHRYTHLGPGRGKATRHLSAVNQLGFAGGGVPRPFASAVLPAVTAAGGGTIGRVMPVPEGLVAAAAASIHGKRKRGMEETSTEINKEIREEQDTPGANSGNAWSDPQVKVLRATSESVGTRGSRSRSELILSMALIVLAILYIRELQNKQIA